MKKIIIFFIILNCLFAKEQEDINRKNKEKWEIGDLNAFVFSSTTRKYEFSHYFAFKEPLSSLSYGINLTDGKDLGIYLGYGVFTFGSLKAGINSKAQPILGMDINIPIVPFINAGFKISADYVFEKRKASPIYSVGYMVLLIE